MIGIEPTLGVAPATEAELFVILSPVGPYFSSGVKPVNLLADPNFVRAWPGGSGYSKMGSNYAPTLYIGVRIWNNKLNTIFPKKFKKLRWTSYGSLMDSQSKFKPHNRNKVCVLCRGPFITYVASKSAIFGPLSACRDDRVYGRHLSSRSKNCKASYFLSILLSCSFCIRLILKILRWLFNMLSFFQDISHVNY